MPAAKQNQRTASRGRSSSNGSRSRSQSRPASKTGSRSSASGTSSRNRSASGTGSRNQPRKSQRANATAGRRPDSNGSRSGAGNGTLINLGVSALSATLGVAGGVLLGRAALQQNRKVLGVAIPSKIDLSGVGQQLGEAGRQFGKLASEVRAVREKAEQIGKALT